MVINQTQRPQFYQNQYLGSEDLAAIVEYSRIQNARHDLGAHTWGIAIGLQLKEKPSTISGDQVDMYISPGYAWDGFGRPIVVLAPYKIPADRFKSIPYNAGIDGGNPAGHLVEIWLRYNEIETQGPRPGFEVCDPADQFARVQESFQIEVGDQLNPRDPIVIAGRTVDATLALKSFDANDPIIEDVSIPHQTFPDDNPNTVWLIPLGFVRWKPNPNPGLPGNFVSRNGDDITQSRRVRQYIGVVTEGIQAADDIIRLQRRATDDSTLTWSNDLVWIEGDLRVDGNAKLFGTELDFLDPSGQDNGIPLTMKRASMIVHGQAGGGPQTVTELQVTIGQSNDGNNRFAVGPVQKGTGTPPPPDVFQEKFTVRADGLVGIGTTTPRNPLGIRGTGSAQELISFEDPSGITKWHINQNLNGNSGLNFVETGVADGRLFIQAGGNVGVGTPTPTNTLHVNSNTGIRQNRLYLSGGDGWSSLTYNAYHNNANNNWVFPDSSHKSVTIEMDDNQGVPRFEVWSTTSSAPTNWIQRLAINGDSGSVSMAHNGGNVGIGTTSAAERLDVRGNIKLHFDGSLYAPGGTENLRVLRGTVNPDGSTATGAGFTVSREDTGRYSITFPPFPSPPSGSATQIFFGVGNGGDTRDNAVFIEIDNAKVRVKTGDSGGIASDRAFTFVILGPR